MKRHRVVSLNPTLAGFVTSILFTAFAFSLNTLPPPVSPAAPGGAARYDAAHEITVTGDVQEVSTNQVVGHLAGLHVLVAGPQGTVDAHLGPYLSKDTEEALQAGTRIQVVGAMETLGGEQVLLVRQLIFGGRMITVRSPHGFLVQEHVGHRSSSTGPTTRRTESNGGSR
jgi:DNA/RNA endonuclease YhcR with UshA esterase domain